MGQKVLGIELVYLPRSKFTGVDRIRYTVKFKDVTHAVDAEIGVTSDTFNVDMQHSALSLESCGDICMAGLQVGIAPFVRVPANTPKHVTACSTRSTGA